MPLDVAALQSGVEAVCSGPGPSAAACARQWADALEAYASQVVPLSTTVAQASNELASSLATAFSSPAAAPGMEAAFATFAATVGGGMVGFVAAPPPRPVGFASLFLQPPAASHAAAAERLAALIDTWMRTATATPPGGSPAPWG